MSRVLSTSKSRALLAAGIPLGLIFVWGAVSAYNLFVLAPQHEISPATRIMSVHGVVWLAAVIVALVLYKIVYWVINWVYDGE